MKLEKHSIEERRLEIDTKASQFLKELLRVLGYNVDNLGNP